MYQGNVGPWAHHNPTTKWLLWGSIGPYRKGTTNVCCDTAAITTAVKRYSFPGFCLYILDTHIFWYTFYNCYFHKTNKNFKSIRQPNTKLMLQKNLLKMLVRYRFDSAKCFLKNYSYIVTCCVLNWSQDTWMTSIDVALVLSLLTLGIFNT